MDLIAISAALLVSLWLTAATLVATALSPLGVWIAIEVQKDLPALVSIGLLAYLAIKTFTPNPKRHSGLIGLFWWESLEHLVIPLILTASAFMPLYGVDTVLATALLYLLYGRLLGSAEKKGDHVKLVFLITTLQMLPALPSLVLFLDYACGLHGYVSWLIICASSLASYVWKARRSRVEETV